MRHAVLADRRQHDVERHTHGPSARRPRGAGRASASDEWLTSVAASAAADGQAPADLLGEYLPLLADAAINGRRPDAWELDAVRELGRRAAAQGVGARGAVDLYLSAAWRLWRQLPVVVRSSDPEKVRRAAEAVLRVLDDAIGVLVDGHQAERREMIRHEEAQRAEFVDDLLRGDADVSRLVERAEPFGIDLGKPHLVALVAPRRRRRGRPCGDRAGACGGRPVRRPGGTGRHEGRPRGRRRPRCVPPGPGRRRGHGAAGGAAPAGLPGRWRVAAGRAFRGAYGVARSYEEALEALTLADRLDLDSDVVHARDLLVLPGAGPRPGGASSTWSATCSGRWTRARGGAEVLLDTLREYFNAGEVATEAARRLHVSVRTVTYRLARVAELTGYRVSQPDQRFALHAAVLGARLLEWPAKRLPAEP